MDALKDRSGVVLIEFALVLPLLVILFLGGIELARFALIQQRLDKATAAMADFVAEGQTISATNLATFAMATPQILAPFTFDGTVIFSSVASSDTPELCASAANCITWQQKTLGSDASRIGSAGGTALLPAGYAVDSGQNIVVAETFLTYAPILPLTAALIPGLAPRQLYRIAICKPRQGLLTALE